MATTVELTCSSCGKSFERRAAEARRNANLGRRPFCSRACAGRESPSVVDGILGAVRDGNNGGGRKADEFSPFRSHLRRLGQRKREVTVTLEDLKLTWDAQRGLCPLAGVPMILDMDGLPLSASLDRIDNAQGYTPGNIRWVCLMVNLARNAWDDAALIGMARLIASHHADRSAGEIVATGRVGATKW